MGETGKIEFRNWVLNAVTDEDVSRPSLTGYNLTYNE